MVYYVRFLKPPRVQPGIPRSVFINTLVCITTDLGDAFLAEDVDLLVTLALHSTEEVLHQQPVKWTAGKRELAISLGPLSVQLVQQPVVLSVAACDPSKPQAPCPDQVLGESGIPLVISGWSAPFGGSHGPAAEKLIERRFGPVDKINLKIWEETGNSIARHIWDAAVASVIYLQKVVSKDPEVSAPPLQDLLQPDRKEPLSVIELGAGCGIFGLALAQLLPRSSVLLTDLPEVEDIITRNISVSKQKCPSEVNFQKLAWRNKTWDKLYDHPVDLILLSDCTYNVDTLPALVATINNFLDQSPNAIVLVALKRRHASEFVFFDLMGMIEAQISHQDCIQLPSQHDEVDQIEIYCYRRVEGSFKAHEHLSLSPAMDA